MSTDTAVKPPPRPRGTTFGEDLRASWLEVWAEIQDLGIRHGAVWRWEAKELTGHRFYGTSRAPVGGGGPVLGLQEEKSACMSWDSLVAWEGLSRKRLYDVGNGRGWLRVGRGDTEALALRLNQALARWLGTPYAPKGEHEKATLGRLLIEEAAKRGDVEALHKALQDYGREWEPRNYWSALWDAGYGGHIGFIKALVKEFPEVQEEGYYQLEPLYHTDIGLVDPTNRRGMVAFLEAGMPVPEPYAGAAAYLLIDALADRVGDSGGPQGELPGPTLLGLLEIAIEQGDTAGLIPALPQRLGHNEEKALLKKITEGLKTFVAHYGHIWPRGSAGNAVLLACLTASGWPARPETERAQARGVLALGLLMAQCQHRVGGED